MTSTFIWLDNFIGQI